ncbi:hypothetical protein BWQ96_09241 [Gracilariopsis chorda]|uniref:Uncharacterized protein n=1 Tax=Gracilariopsis chorda TaxID=448386 RepID=A0A2V3IG27_9FLOR|nr:hypothetical protein BWQ96_09241 [Gracilariopsis chorda]|eukprot:PXF41046.1 hypothetical protein BWQ96_09241 [Gracilariopsis chorda]
MPLASERLIATRSKAAKLTRSKSGGASSSMQPASTSLAKNAASSSARSTQIANDEQPSALSEVRSLRPVTNPDDFARATSGPVLLQMLEKQQVAIEALRSQLSALGASDNTHSSSVPAIVQEKVAPPDARTAQHEPLHLHSMF